MVSRLRASQSERAARSYFSPQACTHIVGNGGGEPDPQTFSCTLPRLGQATPLPLFHDTLPQLCCKAKDSVSVLFFPRYFFVPPPPPLSSLLFSDVVGEGYLRAYMTPHAYVTYVRRCNAPDLIYRCSIYFCPHIDQHQHQHQHQQTLLSSP